MAAYERLLETTSPKLVAVTQMSNVLGTMPPVERDDRRRRTRPARWCCWTRAQSVPHLPVDVRALDCDFLAFSGHKMLGPTGIGVLWGRRELLEAMPPFLGGGDMIREVTLSGLDLERPAAEVRGGHARRSSRRSASARRWTT